MENINENPISSNPMDLEVDGTSPELPKITSKECLELLGLGSLADKKFRLPDGRIIKGDDFLEVCPTAGAFFIGFKKIDPRSEEYEGMKELLTSITGGWINPDNQCD